MPIDSTLRITEIFLSLQGEARSSGRPTVFVRLTGCPLRCHYCDSEYAFEGGKRMTLAAIVKQVLDFRVPYVCVTGGEPLAQSDCWLLLCLLCDNGLNVSLETSGALSIEEIDNRVSIVMDLKTPMSGEVSRNNYHNIDRLRPRDQLKFVICNRQDYQWASFKLTEYGLADRVDDIWFSPAYGQINPAELAQWILDDRLPVRLQLQLHKIIWGDLPGR
jgi:7-carboxy-7-deazaguanine synthase